ncbi:rhomboid family intramembrane serine protease [Flavobacteriaceae bacterium]|jgi:membrane associated rhomboid family serine protease|nr:rhomboid family intramembrane serine protease [Flavobacteriaceae bacterium]
MTSLLQDLQDKLKRLTAFEKIIAINVVVFFIGWFVNVVADISRSSSLNWLELSKDFSAFILKPWTLITYGFTHIELWHMLMNMFVLYFVGRSFSNLFNTKTSLNIYLLGIISGGLVYLLTFALFPEFFKSGSSLVGASAGVRATLIFLCAYMPHYEMRLGSLRFKLMYVGFTMVILDLLGLFGANSGGNVAHLGGDLLGYFYATRLRQGIDIGKGFEKLLDVSISLFSFTKKANLKTVYKDKSKVGGYERGEFNQFNNQKKIDIILDKISKSGYESLTKDEKEFLFRAGKK